MWVDAEALHAFVLPLLCDVLTGPGLACVLGFSAVSPDAGNLALCVCAGALTAALYALLTPQRRPLPEWLSLCGATFALLLSLAVFINVMGQLCPQAELSAAPAYVLLCVARVGPTRLGVAIQCCLTAIALGAVLLVSTEASARPGGAEALDVGSAVQVWLAVLLACVYGLEMADEAALHRNDGGYTAAAVVIKGGLLLLLALSGRAALYQFAFPRPTPVPSHALVIYGALLLLASLQTAAAWFERLRRVLTKASARVLVRIQHIVYALVLAAAWVFPLQLHVLRSILVAFLLAGSVVYRWAK